MLAGLSLLTATPAAAQLHPDSARSRLSFAQLALGADMLALPAAQTQTRLGGVPGAQSVPAIGIPRLIVGGTHFWGWAEFYLAIPLRRATLGAAGETGAEWGPDVETTARFYAGPIAPGRVRPFVGVGLGSVSVRETRAGEAGPTVTARIVVPSAGIALATRGRLFEAGVQLLRPGALNSPIDGSTAGAFRFPGAAVWVGAKWWVDGTSNPGARAQLEREGDGEARFRREGIPAGFFVGAGPTSAWALGQSTHNVAGASALPGRDPNARSIEFTGGWHFPAARLSVAVPLRRFTTTQRAFGIAQERQRHVVSVEALRFLGDYVGFVPFAGVTLGFEQHRFREQVGRALPVTIEESRLRPGLVVGWDIRPTRNERLVLRTNLRYTPGTTLDIPTRGTLKLPDFEFNFIQLVWHLGGGTR